MSVYYPKARLPGVEFDGRGLAALTSRRHEPRAADRVKDVARMRPRPDLAAKRMRSLEFSVRNDVTEGLLGAVDKVVPTTMADRDVGPDFGHQFAKVQREPPIEHCVQIGIRVIAEAVLA